MDIELQRHLSFLQSIGSDAFSAAIVFALQDYGLATLIGEETANAASYYADVPYVSPFPCTGLLHRISRTCYVRPSGILDGLPVTHDLFVDTTIDAQLAGQDLVLQSTLEMIQHSK